MDLHTAAPVHTQRMSLGNFSAPEPRILDRRQATPLCTSAISQERIQRRKKLSCERTLLLASEPCFHDPHRSWVQKMRELAYRSRHVRCVIRRPGATLTDRAAQPASSAGEGCAATAAMACLPNGQLCVTALAVASSFMRAFWPGVRQGRPRARAFHCAAAVVTRSERAMTSIASPGSKSASSDAGRRSHPSPLLRMIVTAGRTPLLAASTDAIRP